MLLRCPDVQFSGSRSGLEARTGSKFPPHSRGRRARTLARSYDEVTGDEETEETDDTDLM